MSMTLSSKMKCKISSFSIDTEIFLFENYALTAQNMFKDTKISNKTFNTPSGVIIKFKTYFNLTT